VSNNGQPVVLNDRYELEQRIGRGGMADVFLARDQLLNRQVAIKVLFPEFATDPNFVERFRREAQSAANLNHPNIVGVYDWGQYSNTYFMAMEYVRGRTLADILRANGHINSVQAAEIASEIAAALGNAHRNGVAHRDIKPANILIGANGQVKVADFGIARAMNAATESNLTQVGNVMGTATYFSPEQAQGAQPDPRSDLYSLGVVLYEMVAGRPPFLGDNPVSIAYKQVHDTPQPLHQIVADVPRAYEAIVAKLLSKQPEQRYPSAEALRDDLRRFRNGEPVQALGAAAGATTAAPATTVHRAPDTGATTAMPRTTAVPSAGGVSVAGGGAPPPRSPNPRPGPPMGYEPIDGLDDQRRGSWYAIAGFVALLALVAGGIVLFNAFGNDDEAAPTTTVAQFELPNVVGMDLEEATRVLSDLGLSVTPTVEEAPSEVEENQVSSTLPSAGQIVATNETIILYYKPKTEPVAVPSVVGKTQQEAIDLLTAAGFTVAPPNIENNPDVPEGQAIRTEPAEGTPVKQGSPVTLFVSGGPDKISVPSVQGLSEADATKLLSDEPFALQVTVTQQDSGTVDKGAAIGTTPAAGEQVTKGSAIKLIVSTGPAQKTVPELGNLTEAQARNLLAQNGLGIEVTTEPVAAGSPQDGRVISQDVPAGTKVDINTKIKIKIGKGVPPTTVSTTVPDTDPPPTTNPPTSPPTT
jgi:eukaryotic-like serine/threonine-protein kinase